ncbi:LytR/AlgR family response regulator transcription factor [Oerskovia jenensis]|uniref:DNA-binding LytR/AlgR family response regulator n=1 Tax=Oerskovia jenensis TaxID=162169 RepID=A0ABS2LHB1_9CELL|nr:LytTR family DNA-binding domain-containing protein [Oerskovia jenensis]MBM7479249.1 DNA-binding LytR/AlgR family response regulator [Oerskovia jenensis]
MIRIGVVDDEPASRDIVLGHLDRFQVENDVTFDVRTFSDGRELVTGYRPDFDILFLDVQMNDLDGLDTARHIRTLDSQVVIVFVTNMAQYAIQGYEVDALSYLLKPVPWFAFSQELRRSIDRVRRSGADTLMLTVNGALARVDLLDVVYIESIKHRVIVHAVDRTYAFTGALKTFEADLADKGFFRSNSCYLVNMRHVTAVDQNTCVMRGGDELQVSRPRKRAFLDALADHVGGRVA